jgi:choline dehydrogenase-like flavoprotein
LIRLSENARRLLERYGRRRRAVQAAGLRLGRARAAVLTEPRGQRGACELCDLCLWGCRHEAIYGAAQELPALERREGLDYRPGALAESIAAEPGGGYAVRVRGASEAGAAAAEIVLRAPRVVLAAGALATTRLVLDLQGRYDVPVPVVGVPGTGFALFLPERLGAALAVREFSMGQISFSAAGDPDRPDDAAYGTLFPASGLPGSMLVERMPLSRPGAVRLFRHLQPALLVGNCFLPGRYDRSVAHLRRDADGRSRLVVQGAAAPELPARLRRLRRQITRAFLRLGALVIPGSFTPIGPGEDVRYSGMLPMRADPGPGEVDRFGELHGSPGLHVADLAVFPTMSAKHHTLTLMANADRIGRAIAERWRRGERRA